MIKFKTTYRLFTTVCAISFIALNFVMPQKVSCQEVIKNVLTEQYYHIEGTQVKLLIPTGFEAASTFKGIQSQTANISVVESSTPYATYIEKVIPSIVNNNITQMVEKSGYIINGLPAKLYKGTQKDDDGSTTNRMFLVLGTENQTIAFNCNYAIGNTDTEEKILKGILSVIYAPEENKKPDLKLGYRIDLSKSTYRMVSQSGSAITYSKPKDGNITPSTFLLMRHIIQNPIQDFESYIYKLIDLMNFKAQKVVYSKSIVVDGLNGIEMLVNLTGKKSGQPTQGYFITIFDSNYTYSLIGHSFNEEAKEEMKEIFYTLKRN
ncbi:hypothetical protein [Sphingobacterium hungaricum]